MPRKEQNLIKSSEIRCFYCSCYYHRLPEFQNLPFHVLSLVLPKSTWYDLITEPLNPQPLGCGPSWQQGNSS